MLALAENRLHNYLLRVLAQSSMVDWSPVDEYENYSCPNCGTEGLFKYQDRVECPNCGGDME